MFHLPRILSLIFMEFYFVFGMLYYQYQKVLDTKMKLNSSLCAIILIGFTFFLVKIEVSDMIKAIVGILASISLGYVYLKYNLKFFDHLNGSTYAIYLFSWFPQVFLIYVFMFHIAYISLYCTLRPIVNMVRFFLC